MDQEFNKITLNNAQVSLPDKSQPASAKAPVKAAKVELPPVKKRFPGWLKWLGLTLVSLLLLLLVMAIPIMILAGPLMVAAQQTYASAQAAYTAAKNQDLIATEEKLKETHQHLIDTQNQYLKLQWTNFIPGIHWYYQDGDHGLKATLASLEAAQILAGAVTSYADVLGFKGQGSFMGGTAEDRIAKMVQTLDKVTPEIDKVAEKLKVAEDNLTKINPNHYPQSIQGKPVREKILQAQALVHGASLAVTDAKPVLAVLPKALGYPAGKK